ncbi:group-specific protein [Peribacillus frigoritolerans]|uniref:group-specific protein n=1 Tax=Peribacillus frigoritolerans TaxID=450367 RepID=UPI003DA0E32F
MFSIQIDENKIENCLREEMIKRLNNLEHSLTFWDMKELCRQTKMSENFIKEQFFYDNRFPKVRVGRKWVMPAKATEEFLLLWLSEQKRINP